MARAQRAIARRTTWVLAVAGLLVACGGTAVSGTGGGAGGGGHPGGGAGGSAATGGGGGCPAGYADCNGDPSDGCETHIASDPAHCGACNTACTSPPGGVTKCVNGACQVCACAPGRGDCNNNCADGCETDLTSDANNCGSCGHACSLPNATAACTNGKCTIAACDKGFGDCDGKPADGCETNLAMDAQNCGSCGNQCPSNNGGPPTCNAGSCIQMCCDQPGYASCDGTCNCTDLLSDPNNCGYCGHVCSVKNGLPFCKNGQCTIGACYTGFADCDGQYADGCEADLSSDINNCGACGSVCAFTGSGCAYCTGGSCTLPGCTPGTGDCDCIASNGCETNLTTDPQNCGACGTVCPTGQSCVSGVCK